MTLAKNGERALGAGWRALAVITVVELLIFLDISVVNVALPSMAADLGLDESGLAWVVSAYLLTFGGFQLVGGRAADLLGVRRVFQFGLLLFTVSSLTAGLADSAWLLIASRALQGVGAAIVVPAQLSLLATLFTEPRAYQRAFGVWSAMAAAGAAAGAALGGALIQGLGWPWIFLINVPVGVAALIASQRVLPADSKPTRGPRQLDLPGAAMATAALLLIGYGLGTSGGTAMVAVLAGLALAAGFLLVEARSAAPLMPLRLFRIRNVSGSALVNVAVGAAHVPAFLLLALYFQQVLGYSPLESGIAVLPVALVNIAASRLLIPAAMQRYGVRVVLTAGMLLQAAGLVAFARMPVHGSYLVDVLPASVVFALGLPAAFIGVTVPAVKSVAEFDTGVAAGIVNTAQRIGSGLGVTALTALAAAWTTTSAATPTVALNSGLQAAFLGAAGFAVVGAVIAVLIVRDPESSVAGEVRA